MYRQIPNLITIARLLLTVLFFAVLHINDQENFPTIMWAAFVIFLMAAGTDFLDGYLARKWKVESAFGRVVDPFVDKIMICGAFIFFASDDFINVITAKGFPMRADFLGFPSITGVRPWMAVLLIAREFLITGIRGLAESKGIDFRADWAGKIKMIVQSVAVGGVLVDLATQGQSPMQWVYYTRNALILVTLLVTVLSTTSYIVRARRIIHD